MRNRVTSAVFLAVVSVSATAEAASITFNFTGTATASFAGGIVTPAPLTGSFTFESTTADTNVSPFSGSYAAITAFSINVGGYVDNGSAGTISVSNDGFSGDRYVVSLPVTTLLGGFAPLGPFELDLGDNTLTALSSDALPTSINLAAFGSVRMFLLHVDTPCDEEEGCTVGGIFGNITSLTVSTAPAPVPEPGTFVLIGTGIAIALARRRRR